MKKVFVCCLLFFLIPKAYPHIPIKTQQNIIIDTDCAIDDMRAISILLSRPEITIKAILLSDGSLSPAEGLDKIKGLLNEFNRDTIPIALGEVSGANPPWRSFNQLINWGYSPSRQTASTTAVDLLSSILKESDKKISIICLGPLTTVCRLIQKDPFMALKIERVVWYNESVDPLKGFNYECDKPSAEFVMGSGVRLDVISNLQKKEAGIDTSYFNLCKQLKNNLSRVLYNVYNQPPVHEKLVQGHFNLCDDLVALYLTNSELFDIDVLKNNVKVRYNKNYNMTGIREVYDDMINNIYLSDKNVVFIDFPKDRKLFTYDVRQIMDTAIARFGPDEWKANVMTDEFHGHLGVFSIVGAKMGIKAREYFNVGPDQMEVITFAGSKPPYSCLNDGLQVSTGATLGMGTIHLSADTITRPVAIFKYKDRTVQFSLKPEYLKIVDADIKEALEKFGITDDGYWRMVRMNALKYWLSWDRNKIFDIKEIN